MARRHGARSTTGGTGARYRIWQTMRMFAKQGHPWTLREMAAVCETHPTNAGKFISGLAACGYVEIASQSPGLAGGDRRHRLVRDTGPLAPRLRLDLSVWDANTGEVLQPVPQEVPADD